MCNLFECDNRTFKEEGENKVTSKVFHFILNSLTKYLCFRIERVNGKDNLIKTTVLPGKHFRLEDVYLPPGGTKKRLS